MIIKIINKFIKILKYKYKKKVKDIYNILIGILF